MLNLIIFGPPGAGKGTQAKLIAKEYKLIHLSSGAILRQEAEKNDKIGKQIKRYQSTGKLVPNKLTIKIVEDVILTKFNKSGFILDGYPRNLAQAKALDNLFEKQKKTIDLVLNIKLSEKEAVRRIMLRAKTSGRSDDNLKIIENRFQIYHTKTSPLLKYYRLQRKVINIDDRPGIEIVFKEIKEAIKKLL